MFLVLVPVARLLDKYARAGVASSPVRLWEEYKTFTLSSLLLELLIMLTMSGWSIASHSNIGRRPSKRLVSAGLQANTSLILLVIIVIAKFLQGRFANLRQLFIYCL